MPTWLKNLLIPLSICTLLTFFVWLYTSPIDEYIKNPLATWPQNYTVVKDINTLEKAKVTQVFDGDTIEINGKQHVRFLGIDTPETHHPRKGVQCYGLAASSITKKLLTVKTIYLEKDIENMDKYNRLLRYIYLPKPNTTNEFMFVNVYLVAEGYAHILTIQPNVTYTSLLTKAQNYAQQNGKGLWSGCKEEDFK